MAHKDIQPIWILVNCNNIEEAKIIGDLILTKRLGSCYDIFQRELTKYFWPPKTGNIEQAKGALLVIESFASHYQQAHSLIKQNHADQLPFIGFIPIQGVSRQYHQWMGGEIE
ncbi:divalent-cation tolerance protein CutA [Candidatus Berkelbacteria bacterium]|nr:divalent-cation tolerance protein CutA [Candidatus Berkelbacteria bacterium]